MIFSQILLVFKFWALRARDFSTAKPYSNYVLISVAIPADKIVYLFNVWVFKFQQYVTQAFEFRYLA
jgi:hypothetical protein